MHSKSDNVEVMISDETDEIIEKLFNLLKTDIKIIYSIQLLCYKCHKINLWRGQSYIDSPDWMKNKKATVNPINPINPINPYNKCCQYTIAVSLN